MPLPYSIILFISPGRPSNPAQRAEDQRQQREERHKSYLLSFILLTVLDRMDVYTRRAGWTRTSTARSWFTLRAPLVTESSWFEVIDFCSWLASGEQKTCRSEAYVSRERMPKRGGWDDETIHDDCLIASAAGSYLSHALQKS